MVAAQFESRDLPWNGIDRRQAHRRQLADRRMEVRFDPSRTDRRQSAGRRRGEQGGWNEVRY